MAFGNWSVQLNEKILEAVRLSDYSYQESGNQCRELRYFR